MLKRLLPYLVALVALGWVLHQVDRQALVSNIRHAPLADLITRNLRAFRSTLDVDSDPTCGRCVCSLNAGWRRTPWMS